MLSVIIPVRNERWLQQTINDLLAKAEGEIEIIVVMDGVWQDVEENPRVKIIKQGTVWNTKGMREGINAGMALASGEWVMKCDGHTMWDQGFDVKLIADCDEQTVVVPRRYRLDVEKWELINDGRPPVDYMFIDYPYFIPHDPTQGLHGAEWKQPDRDDILIDDLMTFQGSAYFMHKKHWEWQGDLDTVLYGPFTHESQEISNKAWLGGRRVIVNKKTWYAHLHKGKKYGTGYGFSNAQWEKFKADMEFGRRAAMDIWLNNKWVGLVHDWEWLIDKFWPVPHWPFECRERIITDRDKDWSTLGEDTWKAR
jgi:glycosyltransferase involved in cell wall biosynthesis